MAVGVVENIPVDANLGWDLPVLMELLHENELLVRTDSEEASVNVSCPFITRAQAKPGIEPLPHLDSSLCEGGTKGPRKIRRQWHFEKQLRPTEPKTESSTWEVPNNIAVLQRQDDSLTPLFAKSGQNDKRVGKERFTVENDILYIIDNDHKRLFVPTPCHPLVMYLIHTLPWA